MLKSISFMFIMILFYSCKEIQLNLNKQLSHNCPTHIKHGNTLSCKADLNGFTTASYSLNSSQCPFISINSQTGEISASPSLSDAGRCEVTISANSISKTFDIAVIGNPMVTEWRVNDPAFGDGDSTITLPLREGFKYNFTVDWGDGSSSEVTSYNDPDITHDYGAGAAADYIVTIDGLAEAWYFNDEGDKDKIIEVTDLGGLGWVNFYKAFSETTNLIYFFGGQTRGVTNMVRMFAKSSNVSTLDVSSFDTSKVTTMHQMFWNTSAVTNLNLLSFDTRNVVDMSFMFWGASGLSTLDLSSFNTSRVTNMKAMFQSASGLMSLDLSNFDTSNVVNMESMFFGASSLSTLNIGNFDTSRATNLGNFFSGTAISSLNLDHFDTSRVTNFGNMFKNMSNLTSLSTANFDTSKATTMWGMFNGASSITSLDLSHFDTSSVESFGHMFSNTTTLSSLNLTGWDISSSTNASNIWLNTSPTLICDQGGSPGTGDIFGEACN